MNVYHWILEAFFAIGLVISVYKDLKEESFKVRAEEIAWDIGIFGGIMLLIYLSSR